MRNMRKTLTYLTVIDLVFILFLSLSGFFAGLLSRIVYYLAFIIPFALTLFIKNKISSEFSPLGTRISRKEFALVIPTVAPTLALVFLISWLTSILLSFVGKGSVTDVSGNIFVVILIHAVLPAILEEALFRYIPIAFIAPYTKRGAVLISALFFGLVHCNLYQLPYAFFAGVIFALSDIAFDSILPSVILHFLNNLTSVFWLRLGEDATFALAYIITLVALALISLIIILIFRKEYKKLFMPVICDKRKYKLSYEPIILVLLTLFIAVTNLI